MLSKTSLRAELSGSTICTAAGQVAIGHTPVLALCRQLIEAGRDPATPLKVYRGNTLALRIRSIGEAAVLEINTKGTGFIGPAAVPTAPPIARNWMGVGS
jgi:hypothetical protein